jgi:cell wall-associated NlpC family hydrolase
MAASGAFLVYVGIRRVPLQQGLREILKGQLPAGQPAVKAAVPDMLRFRDTDTANAALFGVGGGLSTSGSSGSGSGGAILAAARKYLGTPYMLGGRRPGAFDCSGLVTWVLVQDCGYTNLPSLTHTVTGQFLYWSGATNIARNEASAGDLACTSGHIGICIDNKRMVHAPTWGEVVKEGSIMPGAIIRRVKPK